jgi:DNA-binding beta-propeller fold protein YncE
MVMQGRSAAMVLLLGAILATAGCGTPRGLVFEPLETAIVWPPPPEAGRIQYVGSLTTSDDLKPGSSAFENIGSALFGREPARSMLTPYALCTDGDERLYVCDTNGQLVHVFDLDERRYEQLRPDEPVGAFSQPVGIAMDARQRLLVSDSVAATIFVFEPDGDHLGQIGSEYLTRPCGLAVHPRTGEIFVADAAAHQVVVLDGDGTLLRRIGARGVRLGEFNFPTNVAFDGGGRLYVSDTLNFRVQVFDDDEQPVQQIGSHGDLPGYFSQPKGLAADGPGNLYVVDAHFETVQVFDRAGRLLLNFGHEGQGPGEFWLPAGIHIDPKGRIWVADSYNRRVQVFATFPEEEP